jgi:hypothetical protein
MSVMSFDASRTPVSVGVPARKVLRPMAAFTGISLALVAFFVAAGAPTRCW